MRASFAAVAFLCIASGAAAQRAPTVVRVRVVDTAGAPVANADVSALRGLNTVLANGMTDANGVRRLTVPRGADELQIVVRRIGFLRGDQFFRADRDSVSVLIHLRTTPRELPTVQVTAQQSLKLKRYHVTADDIAASKRPISDGLDVITKLRPDMMEPPGPGIFTKCGLYYLWVNGQRVIYPPINPGLADRARQQRAVARSTPHMGLKGQATIPVTVQSALATIKPEHIEEMNYVDCRDVDSNALPRGQNAVFVVLKRGVKYEVGRGTYVVDAAALDSDDAAEQLRTTDGQKPVTPADSAAISSLSSVPALSSLSVAPRLRLLGVFDERTGDPVSDAQVIDVATGTFARTTVTGTIALNFLPEGLRTLQVRRDGYVDVKLDVAISPRDTVSITLVLAPKPK